jgi:hypothetical protein
MPDPSNSANDNIPVDAALDSNVNDDASGEYRGMPNDAMNDEPPYAAGGVGGRPSPRAADEPWSPGRSGGLGDFEGGYMESAAPETVEYIEITETVYPASQDAREMYIESMKANLEERGIDIDALMAQAEGVDASSRGQFLQQLAGLQDLQDRASEMLQSLTQSGESAWGTMTESLDKAYEGLRSALDSARARIGGCPPEQQSNSEQQQ